MGAICSSHLSVRPCDTAFDWVILWIGGHMNYISLIWISLQEGIVNLIGLVTEFFLYWKCSHSLTVSCTILSFPKISFWQKWWDDESDCLYMCETINAVKFTFCFNVIKHDKHQNYLNEVFNILLYYSIFEFCFCDWLSVITSGKLQELLKPRTVK